MGSEPNGLFLWLIAQCLGMHINLIHTNGIWSTRCSGVPDLWDPAIVFVIGHYLAAAAVQIYKEEGTGENSWKNSGQILDELICHARGCP